MRIFISTGLVLSLCFAIQAQSIERIQFSGLASDNNNFQPVAGSPFGTYMSGGGGSLTVASEYGKNTYAPLRVKMLERPSADVSVYPNPSVDVLHIDWKSGNPIGQTLLLLDASGKEVARQVVKSNTEILNLKNAAYGMYILQIGDDKRGYGEFKIIKSK